MSNGVQFDPLLVRYLALELNERLRGRSCAAAPFFSPDRSVTLPLSGGEELRVDLHPASGLVRLLPATPAPDDELDGVIDDVSAPPDERLLRFDVREVGRFRQASRVLVLELQTNQWNAILHAEDGRILSVLNARRAGKRELFAGGMYEPPPKQDRIGVTPIERDEARRRWDELIDHASPEERRQRLVSRFAYTGSVNADWILGLTHRVPASPSLTEAGAGTGSSGTAAVEAGSSSEAFERWWWIQSLPAARPVILRVGERTQPYPVPLEGIGGERVATLLRAFEGVAGVRPQPAASTSATLEEAERLVRAKLAGLDRKIVRLRGELEATGGGAELRARGDLLLAKLHEVKRGEVVARLQDWSGERIEIPLDSQLTPAENAARLYEHARRLERAERQLPALIAEAEDDRERWLRVLGEVERGIVSEGLASRLAVGPVPTRSRGAGKPSGSLPYRLFRTSGGLEVRVGRGAKENDRLTFRDSAPDDVWLHARSVPGSHVVLRWTDAASPPARDLAEAAQLAAVFSRARTSGTVPVDWTRRKYVRKPRGAAPGLVIPQRVRTLFVEPDEELVERLAVR